MPMAIPTDGMGARQFRGCTANFPAPVREPQRKMVEPASPAPYPWRNFLNSQ